MLGKILGAITGKTGRDGANPSLAEVTSDTVTNGVVVPDPNAPVYSGKPVPAYPDRGVAAPAVPPDMLMQSQRKQIDALHQVSSFSREDFDAYILPAIYRYAQYVHLLPASESQHHCGQGGLFRHGLEVAFNAALACEGKVFAFDHWASERDKLVPRWRMCAILGGMTHDMGKPIIDVGAVDASGNLIWNPHAGSLYQWLVENKLSEYYIRWRPGARHKRHESFNALALYRIVPDETLRWLSDYGGQEPLDNLIMALSGTSNPNNPLAALIKQADAKSVSKDIKESRERMAASGMGGANSLAIRIIRAMHDLIQEGVWEINKVGASPIWVTTEGVFGLTEEVIKGAVGVLRDQGETSLPTDYRETLNLLDDWGYLHPNIQPNGQQFLTWEIRIYATDRGKPIEFNAHVIRFTKEELLPRAMIPPEPLRAVILGRDGAPISSGGVMAGSTLPGATTPPPPPAAPAASAAPPPPEASQPDEPSADDMTLPPPREVEDGSVRLLGDDQGEGMLLQAGTTVIPGKVDLMQVDESSPAIRNRAEEMDPRDEQMIAAKQQISKRWPPETPEAAAAFFRGAGTEGQVVITLANRVSSGDLVEDKDVWDVHDKIHFRFPDAFSGLGIDEAELREMLEQKGWTERDANTPSRSTVILQLGGGKRAVTLRFNENMSQAVGMLLPARDGRTVARKSAAVTKRRLPLGPFIDADVAEMIADTVASDGRDSALIRPGFHQFVLQQLERLEKEPDALTDGEIRSYIHNFAKQHRVPSGTWVFFHVTRGENAWAVKSQASKNQQLSFNTQYSLELDLADIDARRTQ